MEKGKRPHAGAVKVQPDLMPHLIKEAGEKRESALSGMSLEDPHVGSKTRALPLDTVPAEPVCSPAVGLQFHPFLRSKDKERTTPSSHHRTSDTWCGCGSGMKTRRRTGPLLAQA